MIHGVTVLEKMADARVPHLMLPATFETAAIVGDDGDVEVLLQFIQRDLVPKAVEFKFLHFLPCLGVRRGPLRLFQSCPFCLLGLLQPLLPFLARQQSLCLGVRFRSFLSLLTRFLPLSFR